MWDVSVLAPLAERRVSKADPRYSVWPFPVTAALAVGVSTVGHPQSSPGLASSPGAPRVTVTLPGPGESSALSRPQFPCLQNRKARD